MSQHVILYDGECLMCVSQMRVLSRLDWFDQFELVPLASARERELAPSLERADLREAIHCLTCAGKVHRGARCLRFASLRLPLLVPLAFVLWIPGFIQIAEVAYRWVSRNRLALSRAFGCKDACAISPKPARGPDKAA